MAPDAPASPGPPAWFMDAMDRWPSAQAVAATLMAAAWLSPKQASVVVAAAARGAVQGAAARTPPPMPDGTEPLTLFEELLAEVADVAGESKMDIQKAKAWLRDHEDGAKLATRLGKQSKIRNGVGHPDVRLRGDIRRMAGARPLRADSQGAPAEESNLSTGDDLPEGGTLAGETSHGADDCDVGMRAAFAPVAAAATPAGDEG